MRIVCRSGVHCLFLLFFTALGRSHGHAAMPPATSELQVPTATIATPPATLPYDVLILGGRVIDGTGNAWFHGDVAMKGGRIARIAPAGILKDAAATERIDARGLVVCPGFIDIQSHSREALLTGDGRVISKVTQGVTTEIMGEGWSNAPANDHTITFIKTDEPDAVKRASEFTGTHGFDAWLRAMASHGSSVNFGSFVGSATIRAFVKGMEQGSPSGPELETMRRLVRDAMEDGAFGLASALIYPPDNFVTQHDLVELAKAMSAYGGIYITHMRSEADQLLEAIDEAIAIGTRGGVPVEIYHLKAAGRRNWFKAAAAMVPRIAAARDNGLDVGRPTCILMLRVPPASPQSCLPLPPPAASSLRGSPTPSSGPRSAPKFSTRRRNGRTWGCSPRPKTS